MELSPIAQCGGFRIAKTLSPPRIYFSMGRFDRAAAESLRQAIFQLEEDLTGHTLIFDYFGFDLEDTDISLQGARDALVARGVKTVYRVGPFERICKLINSLDYENKYDAYFCLSYSELDNLLRMLNK